MDERRKFLEIDSVPYKKVVGFDLQMSDSIDNVQMRIHSNFNDKVKIPKKSWYVGLEDYHKKLIDDGIVGYITVYGSGSKDLFKANTTPSKPFPYKQLIPCRALTGK